MLFSYLSLFRLYSFGSHYYDLGIMHQVVFNTSRGRFLEFTNPHLLQNTSRLAIHFDPVLALFSPFYFIYRGPETLLVLQTLIISLGVIFVWKISRLILKDNALSFLISLIYLFFYPLHFINLFDFHAVALSPTLLLGGVYFLLRENFKINFKALAFLILATLTKENVILVVALLFFWAFLRSKKKGYLVLSFVSFIYFIVVVKIVIPYFAGGKFFGGKYYTLSILENFKRFFRRETFLYLHKIFSPFFYLPLLAPFEILPLLSEIAKNTLSSNANMRSFYFHYLSATIPFLFISFIFGLKKVRSLRVQRGLVFSILVLNIIFSFKKGPFSYFFKKYKVDKKKLEIIRQLSRKYSDENVVLSSTGQIAPFFSGRKTFIHFLFDPAFSQIGLSKTDIIRKALKYRRADVVIVAVWEIQDELAKYYYTQLKQDKNYKLVFESSGIEVYEK